MPSTLKFLELFKISVDLTFFKINQCSIRVHWLLNWEPDIKFENNDKISACI